jgi:uncharacterized membrane protein YhfC
VIVILVLRKIKVNIWLLTAGIITYIASQVAYFPLQYLYLYFLDKTPLSYSVSIPFQLLVALIAAILIAVCEDVARWLALCFLKKNADSWQAALTMGLGFGAITSISMGIMLTKEFGWLLQSTTPGLLENLTLSAAEQETLRAWQAIFAATPWYEPATRGLVFFLTFLIQVLFTIMIWQGVSKRSWKWLGSAFGAHVLFEFAFLLLQKYSAGAWMNVLVVLVYGAILGAILYQLLFKKWIRDHETAKAAARKNL